MTMEWNPIETAPKDGTTFLVAQGGEIFVAKYAQKPPRLAYRMHRLHVESHYENIATSLRGEMVDALVPINEPWEETFRHDWTFWTRGFEFLPSHWMPLPPPPSSRETEIG